MDQKDVLFKEIDLIQACIKRMANNSFEIKKWTVGLIAIMIGFLKTGGVSVSSDSSRGITALFLMTIGAFWYLDAYFLKLERRYRFKYEWIIKNHRFYNTLSYRCIFDLNPHNENMILEKDMKNFKQGVFKVMRSRTLLYFYGCLALFCIFIFNSSSLYQFILSICQLISSAITNIFSTITNISSTT